MVRRRWTLLIRPEGEFTERSGSLHAATAGIKCSACYILFSVVIGVYTGAHSITHSITEILSWLRWQIQTYSGTGVSQDWAGPMNPTANDGGTEYRQPYCRVTWLPAALSALQAVGLWTATQGVIQKERSHAPGALPYWWLRSEPQEHASTTHVYPTWNVFYLPEIFESRSFSTAHSGLRVKGII